VRLLITGKRFIVQISVHQTKASARPIGMSRIDSQQPVAYYFDHLPSPMSPYRQDQTTTLPRMDSFPLAHEMAQTASDTILPPIDGTRSMALARYGARMT
jgi:hypothetical protein